jgi:hypothetical protein
MGPARYISIRLRLGSLLFQKMRGGNVRVLLTNGDMLLVFSLVRGLRIYIIDVLGVIWLLVMMVNVLLMFHY